MLALILLLRLGSYSKVPSFTISFFFQNYLKTWLLSELKPIG